MALSSGITWGVQSPPAWLWPGPAVAPVPFDGASGRMNPLAPTCHLVGPLYLRLLALAEPILKINTPCPTAVRRGGHSWVIFARPLCPIARFPGLGHAHARKIGTLALTPEYYLEMDSAPAHIGPRPVADGHLPPGIAMITSELLVGERAKFKASVASLFSITADSTSPAQCPRLARSVSGPNG